MSAGWLKGSREEIEGKGEGGGKWCEQYCKRGLVGFFEEKRSVWFSEKGKFMQRNEQDVVLVGVLGG